MIFPELTNKEDGYPFNLKNISYTDTAFRAASYIRDIRFCVCSDKPVKAYLSEVSSAAGFKFELTSVQSGFNFTVSVSPTGVFSCSAEDVQKLDIKNSYILFDNLLGQLPMQTTVLHLPLLDQTIHYIPSGLKIACARHPIQKTAKQFVYKQPTIVYDQNLNFINGYNCQFQQQNNSVIAVAGASLGEGQVPAKDVVDKLGISLNVNNRTVVYRGVRAINGISNDLSIQGADTVVVETISKPNDPETVILSLYMRTGE